MRERDRLVYSSEGGRTCGRCGRPVARCACTPAPRASRGDGIVRVGRETRGRRGRGVTTVSGLGLPEDDLRALASELRRRCGSGGALKDGVIEIQGEHRDTIVALLEARGLTVRRSGG